MATPSLATTHVEPLEVLDYELIIPRVDLTQSLDEINARVHDTADAIGYCDEALLSHIEDAVIAAVRLTSWFRTKEGPNVVSFVLAGKYDVLRHVWSTASVCVRAV